MASLRTIDEVAAVLSKSPRWIKEWLRKNRYDRNGEPFYHQIGRNKMFSQDDELRLTVAITGKSPFDLFEELMRAGKNKPAPPKIAEGDIYFIAAGDFVKIGHTRSPLSRIISMRTDCPLPLKILHHEPGTVKQERALHRQFAAFRVHREWFHKTPELLAYIEQRKQILASAVR